MFMKAQGRSNMILVTCVFPDVTVGCNKTTVTSGAYRDPFVSQNAFLNYMLILKHRH